MSAVVRKGLFPLLWILVSLSMVGCGPVIEFFERQLPEQMAPRETPSPPQVPAQTPEISEMEAEIRRQINEIRQAQGLEPLEINEQLAQVARDYSQQMAEGDFFSHVSPDGDDPAERVRSAGIRFRVVAENLFTSTNAPDPVPLAVQGWMESPGHRSNILLDDITETGIGIWQEGNSYYVTQLFMRPLL